MDAQLLAQAPSTYTIEIDNEVIVLDEVGGGLHRLNPAATIVWSCLDGVSTLDEICVDLAEAFGVPYDRMAADIAGITERMLEDRLVTPFDTPFDDTPFDNRTDHHDLADSSVEVDDRAVERVVEPAQP